MVKDIPKENAVSRLRKERGWSQAVLAEKVNTSQPQIDRLEKGQRRMTPEWAKRFAVVFEVHWLDLMDEEPVLTASESALVERYRGLSEADRDAVYRITDAMAERQRKRG